MCTEFMLGIRHINTLFVFNTCRVNLQLHISKHSKVVIHMVEMEIICYSFNIESLEEEIIDMNHPYRA